MRGARDLAVDGDGVAWVLGAGSLRRVDPGGLAEDSPFVPEAQGYPLLAEYDGWVGVGTPDGLVRWTVHRPDGPVPLEDQRTGGWNIRPGSPLALGWSARIPPPPDQAILFADAFGETTRVALPGRPLEVQAFELAYSATCDAGLVAVVTVLTADGLEDAVVRIDLDGLLLHLDSAPTAATATAPTRTFALLGDQARLFQLRTDGGGYAIVEWDLGCP